MAVFFIPTICLPAKMLEVLLETYTALTENQTKKKLAH